jgi:hypothetical protein
VRNIRFKVQFSARISTTQFIPIVVIIGRLVTPEPAIFPARGMELFMCCDGTRHILAQFNQREVGIWRPNESWFIMNPGEDFGDQNDDIGAFSSEVDTAVRVKKTRQNRGLEHRF